MSMNPLAKRIAIACGGTGGHLFPGLAVGDTFVARGCDVTLLVSPKEVDQTAVKSAYGMEVESLPMVALSGNLPLFAACFWSSLGQCRRLFREHRPEAVLAMGGFTSAPPVVAGKLAGARIFLHEANAIPGRAVKLLAPLADELFVQFPTAMPRVLSTDIHATGLPVRSAMEPLAKAAARIALGLADDQSVLLVMGGSQGAEVLNQRVPAALAALPERLRLEIWHQAGRGLEDACDAYAKCGVEARLDAFVDDMANAYGWADLVICRAGALTIAELAAAGLGAILVPYPYAIDDHQTRNADSFASRGAGVVIPEDEFTSERLARELTRLLEDRSFLTQFCESCLLYTSDAADE